MPKKKPVGRKLRGKKQYIHADEKIKMSQLQRLLSLAWCFYEARRYPWTQGFHCLPTKQQVSRSLASSNGSFPDISALNAQHTEQHSNVCKYHFFPLIFKKSDTLLFSINLFQTGSNFCFVLFLPAESNSGFIQAENEQLEFYLEKETWRKLSSIKWLITMLGCTPAPVCRSIKIWMDKEQ